LDAQPHRTARYALIASLIITVALYVVPGGRVIAYPLVLLSTFVHELGHGLTALGLGGTFKSLQIFADASGVAVHGGSNSPLTQGLVAAGGLVGPAIVSALAFWTGRRPLTARIALLLAAAACLVCIVLLIRNAFGIAFVAVLGVALGYVAVRTKGATAQVVLVLLAIQMGLSVLSRGDYLFAQVARTGAGVIPSDSEQIARALGGPYWFWGGACGLFSVLVVLVGVWGFIRTLKPARGSAKLSQRVSIPS